MSILSTYANNFPMPLRGMGGRISSSVLSTLVQSDGYDVCACDASCEFEETAFVNDGGAWWKNDKKSFIKAKAFPSDTIEFKLLKGGVQVASLNSSTYGTFWGFNSPDLINPEYKGFKVDWNLVRIGFGYGSYQVRTVHTSLGTTYTTDSWKFNVKEYNSLDANGTVRIETYQNGVLLNGFDYSGINWYQSLRINGKLHNKTPELIIDNYQDTDRKVHEIQSKIENTWTLTTHLLPSHISNYLNEDAIMANLVEITDYNILNQELYRRKPLYFSNIKDVKNHTDSKKSNYNYELKSRYDKDIKRNISGDYGRLPFEPNTTSTLVCSPVNLEVNGDTFTSIPSGNTYDLIVKDEDGNAVGSKVGTEWIVPTGAVASGVAFQFPVGQQYTNYRTGDAGSRVQAGYYDYTRPVFPEVSAELDMTLGADAWFRLKNPLKVGGVSNNLRFVDVDGGQTWSATGNKDCLTIDKYLGIGIYRKIPDLGGIVGWNSAIDGALTFSKTVNGIVYSDFYNISLEELFLIFGQNTQTNGPGNVYDKATGVGAEILIIGTSLVWTSTTQSNNSSNAYYAQWNIQIGSNLTAKTNAVVNPMYVFDARNLITAP